MAMLYANMILIGNDIYRSLRTNLIAWTSLYIQKGDVSFLNN